MALKFALGKALLELSQKNKPFISLEELAEPYASHLCTHLANVDKQGTSQSSKFLDSCRDYNQGAIGKDSLIETTVRLGFNNVLDAFHVVNRNSIPVKFFEVDIQRGTKGLIITDNLNYLGEGEQFRNLPHEVESRWNLVETAWKLDISRNLLDIAYDKDTQLFFLNRDYERVTVTSSRSALNDYQKGHCFYCFDSISVDPESENLADVDHFFPFVLEQRLRRDMNINGVWNLVLACKDCNRGENGKFERVPVLKYLERLNKRNELLIGSHHPLRETLMNQMGKTEQDRHLFLQNFYRVAKEMLLFNWETTLKGPKMF